MAWILSSRWTRSGKVQGCVTVRFNTCVLSQYVQILLFAYIADGEEVTTGSCDI